jgi:hypothetical protein
MIFISTKCERNMEDHLNLNDLNNMLNNSDLPPMDLSTEDLPPMDLSTEDLPPMDLSTEDLPPMDLSTEDLPPMDLSTDVEKERRQRGLDILKNKVCNEIIAKVLKYFLKNKFVDEELPLLIFQVKPSTIHDLVEVINNFYLPHLNKDICHGYYIHNNEYDSKINLSSYNSSVEDNYHPILLDGTTVRDFIRSFGNKKDGKVMRKKRKIEHHTLGSSDNPR